MSKVCFFSTMLAHATYEERVTYEERATYEEDEPFWDDEELDSREDTHRPLSLQQSEDWEHSTYEDNSANQESTECEGTTTTQNIVTYRTSTLEAALVETIEGEVEEDGEEDAKEEFKLLATNFSEANTLTTHIPNRFGQHRVLQTQIASPVAAPWRVQLSSSKPGPEMVFPCFQEGFITQSPSLVYGSNNKSVQDQQRVIQTQITSPVAAPLRVQLSSKPETEMEFQRFLKDFTTQHLSRFYDSNNQSVREVAFKAAKMVRERTKISSKFIPGLAKLALYDFIFLCDNSCSMKDEDRIPTLKDTLKRVAEFATILSSSGISIRMLNYDRDEDGTWDHLSTVKDVIDKMKKFSYAPGTPLGTRLWSKILEPLILRKASSRTLERPVIVIIITDGEPNQEAPTQLRDSIYHCNQKMQELGYGDAAVVFLISRVGTSEDARVFVKGLGKDELIGKTVYVSRHDLQRKRAILRSKHNVAYTELLIKLSLAALCVRTKDQRRAD